MIFPVTSALMPEEQTLNKLANTQKAARVIVSGLFPALLIG
jgi:hypothetical protein